MRSRILSQTSLKRALPFLSSLALVLGGCEGTEEPEPESCLSDFDCELGQVCNGVGAPGICVPDTGAACGNGVVDEGEECDDGNTMSGDGCEADCTEPVVIPPGCGDGTLDEGEECDDGNNEDGDGCEADCTETPVVEEFCGDGITQDDEECDDGNDVDGDGCETDCTETPVIPEDCGDGVVQDGEECDDGNDVNGDGCENDCTDTPVEEDVCGDNVLGESEECDDGNLTDCDGCSALCEIDDCDVCGNGELEGDEGCDDGNNTPGDGCDADCNVEDIITPPYDGWIAYSYVEGTALDRVAVMAGDGSAGPFEMPAEDRFSSCKYPAFSPDGSQLAYALAQVGEPAIRIVDLASGEHADIYATGFTALRNPQFSPDGTQLIFSAKTADTPNVWNNYIGPAEGGDATALTTVTEEEREGLFVSAAAWSCDGSQLYFLSGVPGAGAGASSDLWVMNPDGTGETQISFGIISTSLVPSMRCGEAILDSAAWGSPVRVDLTTGTPTPFGVPSADSNCSWYGSSDRVVCERTSGPAPDFATCFGGGAECIRDIVVLDLDGELVRNLTQSISARENSPTVTLQPFSELTVTAP